MASGDDPSRGSHRRSVGCVPLRRPKPCWVVVPLVVAVGVTDVAIVLEILPDREHGADAFAHGRAELLG